MKLRRGSEKHWALLVACVTIGGGCFRKNIGCCSKLVLLYGSGHMARYTHPVEPRFSGAALWLVYNSTMT